MPARAAMEEGAKRTIGTTRPAPPMFPAREFGISLDLDLFQRFR